MTNVNDGSLRLLPEDTERPLAFDAMIRGRESLPRCCSGKKTVWWMAWKSLGPRILPALADLTIIDG